MHRDGIFTGYLAQPPLVDEARAAWLRHYAERERLRPLAASYGYGDSHADLVWLECSETQAPSTPTPISRVRRSEESGASAIGSAGLAS